MSGFTPFGAMFKHRFDKETFYWVKEQAKARGTSLNSVVSVAVGLLQAIASNPDLLTEAGREKLIEIGKQFKDEARPPKAPIY